MVSKAIAVFPVCRSPIISSHRPRPIGTRLSTAFNPVYTGLGTDLRAIIPETLTSTVPKDRVKLLPRRSDCSCPMPIFMTIFTSRINHLFRYTHACKTNAHFGSRTKFYIRKVVFLTNLYHSERWANQRISGSDKWSSRCVWFDTVLKVLCMPFLPENELYVPMIQD
jgi:hypothetical protein